MPVKSADGYVVSIKFVLKIYRQKEVKSILLQPCCRHHYCNMWTFQALYSKFEISNPSLSLYIYKVVTPYPQIFSTRGLPRPEKKIRKLKKQRVHKLQNARPARTSSNMMKSSGPNEPTLWLIFLCPRTNAKTPESLTFISTTERKNTL
jgi:hypothetical protein